MNSSNVSPNKLTVRYHSGGSMELNACILLLAHMAQLHSTFRQLLYTCIQIDNIIVVQSPCFFLPLPIPLCYPSIPFYLLGNPPWCDRIPSTLAPGYL
jgi:hypothetical protein